MTWDMPSNPNGDITGYKLTFTHPNGTVYTVQVSSGTSYERTNLDPNTLYTVTVVTGGGDGEPASTSATTDSLRKLASLHVLLVFKFMKPLNIHTATIAANIDNTTSSSLDVSWDPVVDATSYDVSWSESGSSVVLDSQSVNDNAVTVSQLMPHTNYVVTVSAKGTNSKLLAEGSVSGTTDEGSKSMWLFPSAVFVMSKYDS